MEAAPPPLRTPTFVCMGDFFGRHSIFELWEGQSVSKGPGGWPPGGGCKGAVPPCLRKFCICEHKIRNFITHFRPKIA